MKHFIIFALSFFTFLSIHAQNIVGNLNINDPNQTHILITHTGDRLIGKITSMTNQEIVLTYKGNNLTFKRSEVTSIEVQFQENEGQIKEPKADIDILEKATTEPPKTTTEPSKPTQPFEIVGPLDLENKRQKHRIFINDGNIYVGRIKEMTSEKVVLRLQTNNLTFNPSEILVIEVVGYKDPKEDITNEPEVFEDAEDTDGKLYVLTTKRGDRFVGNVKTYEGENVIFELENGSNLTFNQDEVQSIVTKSEAETGRLPGLTYAYEEIPMSGYQDLFLSSTAFNFPRGETEYRNIEVFYNSIDHGVSDNFSIGFGVIPLLIANVVDLKTKLTFDIGEFVHLGVDAHVVAGFLLVDAGENWGAGLLRGNASVGTPEKFINFGYGKWAPFNMDVLDTKADFFTVGSAFRIGEKGRIFGDLIYVSEEDDFDFDNDNYTMLMLGGSWFNKKNRVDFGLFTIPDTGNGANDTVVFPIAGYARKF